MKKFKFFAIALAALTSISLTSCNKDYDEDIQGKYVQITLENGQAITICDSLSTQMGSDSVAGYPIYFQLMLNDGVLTARGLPHNVCHKPYLTDRPCLTKATITGKGKVKGLSKIEGKPNPSDTTANASEEHGYIIKAKGMMDFNSNDGYTSHGIFDPDSLYMRIWLKESKNNGFEVRYQTRY